MRRSTVLIVLGVVVAGLVALAAACGSSKAAPAAPPGPNDVVIKNIAFKPSTITIHPGDTVAWRFEDGNVPHNVTGQGDSSAINSGTKTKGTYTHTFPQAGTFKYRCTIHSGMDGTVVVTP